jgi:murein DD-endopeptidase MepM/ murein hydrolase activator NlpD
MRQSYTFILASNKQGTVRKVRIPFYALHGLLVLALVGGITVFAGVASYTRMLWKAESYNALRREQDTLKRRFENLQVMVKDSNQRLSSLQSLATEVAMTYGIMRFRQTPFGLAEATITQPDTEKGYQQSVDQFNFLVRNAPAVALVAQGVRLMPGRAFDDLAYMPSAWPVLGSITGSFGERMDPFSGEGAFHAGIDISAEYGSPVRATADGLVVAVEMRAGYGRVVVVDHGFGLSTLYGHLSAFNAQVGQQVTRGNMIGAVGSSGRATGSHVHYEVRSNGAPVNPWRYLRSASAAD